MKNSLESGRGNRRGGEWEGLNVDVAEKGKDTATNCEERKAR